MRNEKSSKENNKRCNPSEYLDIPRKVFPKFRNIKHQIRRNQSIRLKGRKIVAPSWGCRSSNIYVMILHDVIIKDVVISAPLTTLREPVSGGYFLPQQEENVCNFTTFPISVSFPSILLENIRKTLRTLFEHFLSRPLSKSLSSLPCLIHDDQVVQCPSVLVCYDWKPGIKTWNGSLSLLPLGQHLLIEINSDGSDQL